MSKQLLIYEQVVPVSKQRHGDWSVKTNVSYEFARPLNAVPLLAAEFLQAAPEYALVFAGQDEQLMPAAVLGIQQQNLYLDEAGAWKAKFIPAFVRRYPFIFARDEAEAKFTLCLDETFTGFNQDGRGERLFDSEGNSTQYLSNVLAFHQEYQAQFLRTQAFCKTIAELELLDPMQAQFNLKGGEKASLTDFRVVNRDRLKQLSGEQLANLMQTDALELLYLHLHSLHNLGSMAERLNEQTIPDSTLTE